MVRVFLILGTKKSTMLSPRNDFGRKNLQSSQVQAILSDIFKILREEIFIPSDEKEISWEDFFEMSHKIARTSRHFFAFKHKHPPKRAGFLRFHQKTAIFKGAENRVFPHSLLARIFVLNGGGKSHKVSLNQNQSQSYKVKVFATVK